MRKRIYSSLPTTCTNQLKLDANAEPYTGTHELPDSVIHNLVGTTELFCSAGLVVRTRVVVGSDSQQFWSYRKQTLNAIFMHICK